MKTNTHTFTLTLIHKHTVNYGITILVNNKKTNVEQSFTSTDATIVVFFQNTYMNIVYK